MLQDNLLLILSLLFVSSMLAILSHKLHISYPIVMVIAGLFLAFPAILPASLTLVKQHDGRARAADDADGARLGAISLACFALVIVATGERLPPALSLLAASIVWLAVAIGLWRVVYRPRR